MAGLGEHLGQGPPEAECAVADREDRGSHTAPCAITLQVGPGFGGLAVADRDQFLGAVREHAHDDEHAGFRRGQADPQVDAVGPDVDVVRGGQVVSLPISDAS